MGPVGMSGMVSCPYTGAVVSRPEDCPEFSNSGGNGGCSGCGTNGNQGPTISGEDSNTRRIKNCIANRQAGREFLNSIRNANITFEYRALKSGEGHTSGLRLGNTDGSNGTYTIIVDKAAIERSATSANWSYRQLLAEVVIHELMHVAYGMDPNRNLSQAHTLGDGLYRSAWDLYDDIFGVRAPQKGYSASRDGGLPRCLRD